MKQAGVPLKSLHAGGMIHISRKLRSDLERWEVECASRAKAEHENAKNTADCVRNDFGADEYDKLLPSYDGGLTFGDSINHEI